MLIYVSEHVPFAEGASRTPSEEGVLEYCATRLYPDYSYDQCLMITGVNRPPNNPHRDYAADLKDIVTRNRKETMSLIVAGDLNLDT